MATKEEVNEWKETQRQLTEEDKQMSSQLSQMEEQFTTENKLTRDGFNEMYQEGVKNFRLDFGVVCEKGRDEVVEGLRAGMDKKRLTDEYLACVEFTRQKAAQRAAQQT